MADLLPLLNSRLGASPGICARSPVVGFRLVPARLLSIAALRFASRQGPFAVAIGFCDGHIVALVCGVVVEFALLVTDLLVRFIQRSLCPLFALLHLVAPLLLSLV